MEGGPRPAPCCVAFVGLRDTMSHVPTIDAPAPRTRPWISVACALWLLLAGGSAADEPAPATPAGNESGPAAPAPNAAPAGVDLAGEQERLTEQFERFETLLLRLAEVNGPTDPRRASLLRKAVARSKDKLLHSQFARLVELLEKQQTGLALGQQQALVKELEQLLEVLLSEDHQRQAQAERERLAAYLKEINRLIQEQQALQVQTERAVQAEETAQRQGKLGDKTGALAEKMQRENPQAEAPVPADAKQPSQDDRTADPADTPTDNQPADNKPMGDQPKPNASKRGEDQPGEDTPAENPPGDEQRQPPADAQRPAAGEAPVRAAQQRMQQAQAQLQKTQRAEAVEEQEAALRELRSAKAELEKALRQMREEELERMLVQLEERLRQMLKIQKEIEAGTLRLASIPQADRQRGDELDSGRLGRRQGLLAIEAEKARLVLEEDGTSVAFVEVLSQVHDDMQQASDRLATFDVGELTQGIERDIVTALEEMLAALEKAQQERQDKQDQPQQGQPQEEKPPRLVDRLAELKLIRSLQFRVNRRTEEISKLIGGPRTDRPELLQALRELAAREERIYHSTRELALETGP